MRLRLILFIAAWSLFAQQDVTIRVNVQQVLVPVVATDKKGHHVSGLHASDFRIFEDGVQQQIASFSSDTAGAVDDIGALSKPASGGVGRRKGLRRPRHVTPLSSASIRSTPPPPVPHGCAQPSKISSKKKRSTGAQYVLIGIGRQLQVLQPATTNPLAILLKIRSTAFQSAMGGLDASAMAAQLQNIRTRMDEFCKRCACGTRRAMAIAIPRSTR